MNVSRFQKTLQIGRIGSGMCVLLLFAILHTDALQTAVYAGPPRTLSYQGLLTNENGESVPDGEYRLSFSLYDVEEEGDALWTESQTVVVEKGIFSALLGSEIPMDLLFDKPYWLEIKVGVDPELTPRIALTSTAYSFRSLKSQNADSVNGISASATPAANSLYPLGPDGKFPQSVLPAGHSGGAHAETHQEGGTDPLTVTGGMIQDGSVDTDNLADDAVTAAKILPDVLSSLDGVVNDGGNVDLVAGSNITITPDDAANTITIAASGTAGSGDITAVNAGTGLTGGGDAGDVTLSIADSGVDTDQLADNAVTEAKITNGSVTAAKIQPNVLSSLDGVVNDGGNVDLVAGSNITITPDDGANTITIAASGTGGGGDITAVNAGIGLTGGGASGDVTLSIADGGVDTDQLAVNAVTAAKIQPNVLSSIDGVANDAGNVDLVAGSNITITPDDGANTITIASSGTGSGGDITAVNAGDGLRGGGDAGDVTLSILDGGVDTDQLADDAVRTGKIRNGTILGEDINSSTSITVDKLQAGGTAPVNTSIYGCGTGIGVYGSGSIGVYGKGSGNDGVRGTSNSGSGVYATSSSGSGVYGGSVSGTGVYGHRDGKGNFAGYFYGNVKIEGTLSKTAGSFIIDHPLDPENKYLQHSFVESPDMMNIYNGNVTLDAQGEAWVTLPDWFGALNRDFRYQLTPVGGPGPGLYIAEKISGNRFKIAGGASGLEVSWQVTGIRHDPYAEAHRIPVEKDKGPDERGRYLSPAEYGLPETMGIGYEKIQEMK